MKKVLFFVSASVGGAERVTVTLGKLLDKSNFIVKFVIFHDASDEISAFIPPTTKKQYLEITNPYYNSTYRIYKCLKVERPDIVFCASPAFNSRLIIASKLIGNIKVVVRNSNMFVTERKDVQWLMRLTYRFADRIILQQQEMLNELRENIKLPEGKAVALHNPIDIDVIEENAKVASPFPNTQQINYVCTARFAPSKGQDVLVRAFVVLHKNVENAHLYLVGKYDKESEYFKNVKTIVVNAGLEDFVHFIGFDSNPYRWVKHCDCFVLPSRYEGLPNSLIEAMYLNKPCVSTLCIPIINRMIEDGYNGYKVPNENYHAMAEAMIKAVKLKDFKMIYKSASDRDFLKLFEEL